MSENQKLHKIIDLMKSTKVLVIGDAMLDLYEHCVVKRISPEAPVPLATIIDNSSFLGGACNVANNAQALGAEVSFVSVVGDDSEGDLIRKLLDQNNINHEGLVVELGRVTTLKKRVVSGTQQLMRIDREVVGNIHEDTEDALRTLLIKKIKDNDVIIISDYCKGLLTDPLIEFIKEEGGKQHKKIFVDSKSRHFLKYSHVYLVKPNKDEAEHFSGEKFMHTYENLEAIGKKLNSLLQSNVVITLGSDGVAFFETDQFFHKKTRAREVFDVSGAGDTVLATIATSIASGATLEQAVDLANHAAGYVVGRLGTTVCNADILKKSITTEIV